MKYTLHIKDIYGLTITGRGVSFKTLSNFFDWVGNQSYAFEISGAMRKLTLPPYSLASFEVILEKEIE